MKSCTVCSVSFKPRHSRQRCCSDACRKTYYKAPIRQKVCAVCGDTFETRRQAQVLCRQPACRDHWRELQRAQREQQPTVNIDLTTEQIEAMLADLAAHRKATRTGLRLTDESIWGYRASNALHQRPDVTTYDLEGALQ